MEKSLQVRIILFPIIVTLITMLSISFIEGYWEIEGIDTSATLSLLALLFMAIYFFTVILVMPIEFYISKIIRNKLASFIVFNIIGLVLIFSIDNCFLTVIEFKSLYLTFPLFSILSFVPKYNEKDS